MTNNRAGVIFPGAGAAVMAAMLLAGGCATSSVEEVAMAPGRSGQPTETGSFPNLNVPRQAATAQLTQEETDAKLAQLTSLQQRQNPGGATAPTAPAPRKKLKVAPDEQEETLKVIEGQ